MAQAHLEWFDGWQREVAGDYERLRADALRDPQKAGHGGESTWRRLLEDWLPPAYEVVEGRKYIIPEAGEDEFETDLIVFNPGYPSRLRAREHVMAGGVAAAFSVKLTIDAAGLRDSVDRSARLRRAMKVRSGSPRSELTGSFAFGLLAHSHSWKRNNSTPRENLTDRLRQLDEELVEHPRECLDFVCVADLATGSVSRMPYLGPDYFAVLSEEQRAHWAASGVDPEQGAAMTAMTLSDEENEPGTVAMFVASLIQRLAQSDPSIMPFADGLRMTNTLGSGGGGMRFWPLNEVFTDATRRQLTQRLGRSDAWAPHFD